MEYEISHENDNHTLPLFVPRTAGTLLIPRPDRFSAAVQVPRKPQAKDPEREERVDLKDLHIPGIGGPAGHRKLFPGDWIVVPQPGYVYVVPDGAVLTPDGRYDNAPLQVVREATQQDMDRTSVSVLKGICTDQGITGPIFGLTRTKPAYVYGEIAPIVAPSTLDVFGGSFAVGPGSWIDPRLLVIGEQMGVKVLRAPRVIPWLYLAREFTRWEGAGTTIEDFGYVDYRSSPQE
jgi:hypothetical protein